jgi:hypothetical protein
MLKVVSNITPALQRFLRGPILGTVSVLASLRCNVHSAFNLEASWALDGECNARSVVPDVFTG